MPLIMVIDGMAIVCIRVSDKENEELNTFCQVIKQLSLLNCHLCSFASCLLYVT